LNGHGPGKNKCSLLKYEDPEKIQCGPEEKMKTDISFRGKKPVHVITKLQQIYYGPA
jgi:hypothetical protein